MKGCTKTLFLAVVGRIIYLLVSNRRRRKSPRLRDKAVLETSTARDVFLFYLITYARAAYKYIYALACGIVLSAAASICFGRHRSWPYIRYDSLHLKSFECRPPLLSHKLSHLEWRRGSFYLEQCQRLRNITLIPLKVRWWRGKGQIQFPFFSPLPNHASGRYACWNFSLTSVRLLENVTPTYTFVKKNT